MTPEYTALFADGSTSPVIVRGAFGTLLVGIAERADHFKRCVFFDRDGHHDADPWVTRIDPPEVAAARSAT